MAEAKKSSKTKQILLGLVLVVILILIGYIVYSYFFSSTKTPADLGLEFMVGEEISEVPFDSQMLDLKEFSELKSYGGEIDVDKVKKGRKDPFIPY